MRFFAVKSGLVGATLLAAPTFFSSGGVSLFQDAAVFAQNSQQSSLVLELQQMRQEIAELRDLIERQQYQIRQLQDAPGVPGVNTLSSGNTVSQVDTPQVRPINSSPAVGTEGVAPTEQTAVTESTDQGFYRPFSGGAEFEELNPEVVSAVQQAQQQELQNGGGGSFPPAVDRSIPAADSRVPIVSAPVNNSAAGIPSQVVPRRPSTSTQVTQGGIVPVPSSGAPSAVTPSTTSSISVGASLPGSSPQAAASSSATVNVPRPVLTVPPTVASGESAPAVGSVASIQPVPEPALLAEDVLYQQGFELLKQFKYDDAVAVFQQQLKQYPAGSYADDGLYWIAESMYLNRKLAESKTYFKSISDNFPQSPRVPDAMLKTAYIEQDQGNQIEARILLQEIIQYHPRSDAAISAKNRLEELQ